MKPNYRGKSIVNLMSSIINARGGKALYPECKHLPSKELKNAKNIVLIVLDGLGYHLLKEHSPNGIFMRHLRQPITSVFPSTTSAAMTSYHTGVAPKQHGITGWHMHLREVGGVVTILPFIHLGGGSLFDKGWHASDIVHAPPVYDLIKTDTYKIIPDYINREYTAGTKGSAKVIPYKTFNSMFTKLRNVLNKRGNKFVHVYWDKIDTQAHLSGPHAIETAEQIHKAEKAFARFIKRIKGTNTHVIVCADHGHMETPNSITLQDHSPLMECLVLPPCAEPRAMSLYVRPEKTKQFERYFKKHLSKYCDMKKGSDMIKQGYYGMYQGTASLPDRVGDYILLPKDGYIIHDTEFGHFLLGNHGGTSKEEMQVPLIHMQP